MLIATRPPGRGDVGVRLDWVWSVDWRLALGSVLLLAAAVRFAAIGSRLHVDDAYTWLVASQPSPHAFLRQLAASENTPPLFYLLLAPLPINDPAWLRLPSALAGVLMVVVVYGAFRRSLGIRVSLLAALAVAVSPFLITDSDLARGFMLEDLALLVALGAVLRLGEAESRKWWAVFLLASITAIYTEYSAAIFVVAVAAAVVWVGRPPRVRMLLMAAVALAAMIPWIPQIVRGQDQVGITKIAPPFATPSLNGLRDSMLKLALGENGGTSSSLGRWFEFAVIVLLAGAAAFVLHRGWDRWDPRGRRAIVLTALTIALTLAGHALAATIGIDVFTQRYMTILVPLAAALAGAAVVTANHQALLVAASVLLVALGLAGVVRRYHAQYEPDFTPVRNAALAIRPRTVLTNTPLVLYYLRSLRPIFDRPSNFGPGQANTCAHPCLIIDDSRAHGGTMRQAPGTQTIIGPYVLTLEH